MQSLEEESSLTYRPLVFNNSSFEMLEVTTHNEAYGRTLRPEPIDCGENIKLYRQYMAMNSFWQNG